MFVRMTYVREEWYHTDVTGEKTNVNRNMHMHEKQMEK